MWVCVVVVFSVVGFSWFKTTSQQFVALVNPDKAQINADQLAEDKENNILPLATISKSWGSLRATIAEMFDFARKNNNIQIQVEQEQSEIKPNFLPLSGDK